MHQGNCQLKSTLLVYSTDRTVNVGCILKIFAPSKAEEVQNLFLFFISLLCPSIIRSVSRLVSLLVSGWFL